MLRYITAYSAQHTINNLSSPYTPQCVITPSTVQPVLLQCRYMLQLQQGSESTAERLPTALAETDKHI
jgi:hypothetical protein